ncbi:MFS transporter [Paenibacillus eucommiae]|uniref:MFS transporter n=1 Tax=Paenibacillus eucommiae TaxID=1355755 RepID=A0ABS4IV53_9BACL|nr:MFS transporter [Paenibacillus eucommiae]MBP1991460.1 hypothetical protein [Paenibacillus eucommiae]
MGLSRQFQMLLMMNAVGNVIFIYIEIFVNFYIWQQGYRISDVAWFNLVLFAVWGVSFCGGAELCMRYSIRLLNALSACFGAVAFGMLSLLVLDNRLLWIACIAVPVGVMWGLFSTAQNLGISLAGKDGDKDFGHYFAILGAVIQVLNVTVPLASALVIMAFGYYGSFLLLLLFIAVMFVVSFFLPHISLKNLESPAERWIDNVLPKRVFFAKGMALWIPISLATGLFYQFQSIFKLLFTFSVTEDKLLIALLNTSYTVAVLVSLYFYRKLQFANRVWMLVGIVFITGGYLFILYPVAPLLIVSNILTTVGAYYFNVSYSAQQLELIHNLTAIQKARLLVWRECLICFSRCVMLLLILPVSEFQGTYFVLLLGISFASLFSIPILQGKMMQLFAGAQRTRSQKFHSS